LRSPSIFPFKEFGLTKLNDQLQFLAFFDYSITKNNNLLTNEDPHVQLASVGPGIRYAITPYASARFDYGWQLYDTGLNTRANSRGHLGIIFSY
jgi:hemolysin activation/secretion protein